MNRLEWAERIGERTRAAWIHEAFFRNATNHRSMLLRVIAKSDPLNRERHRRGFPMEVAVFEEWERRGDELLRAGGFA